MNSSSIAKSATDHLLGFPAQMHLLLLIWEPVESQYLPSFEGVFEKLRVNDEKNAITSHVNSICTNIIERRDRKEMRQRISQQREIKKTNRKEI